MIYNVMLSEVEAVKVNQVLLIFVQREKLEDKFYYENECPSPDSSGNPFVPGLGTKDWSG